MKELAYRRSSSLSVRLAVVLAIVATSIGFAVPAQATADLELVITDTPEPVSPGETVTYRSTLRVTGDELARTVEYDFAIPDGTSIVGGLPTGCVVGSIHVDFDYFCALGNLPVGSEVIVDITVLVPVDNALGPVLTFSGFLFSTTSGADPIESETTTVAGADLSILKTTSADTVEAGTDQVTYDLSVANAGPANSLDVVVTDPLPTGLSFMSSSDCIESAGTVTCDFGAIASGGTGTASYIVSVDADAPAGALTNTATVASPTPDAVGGNNSSSADITVATSADLRPVKNVTPEPVEAGANATFTIEVWNEGPSDAESVVVTDVIPPELSFVSSSDCTEAAGTVTCNIATVPAGGHVDVLFDATVEATALDGTVISNTAAVTAATSDPDLSNNSDTLDVSISAKNDLTIIKTKVDLTSPLAPGKAMLAGLGAEYLITVRNIGLHTAIAPQVMDTIPAETELISVSVGRGTCNGTTNLVCDLDDIPAGGTTVIAVRVFVPPNTPAGTSITNTATVTADADEDLTNNEDSTTNVVRLAADMSVVVVDVPDPVAAGETVTYSVTILNEGPSDIPGSDPVGGIFTLTGDAVLGPLPMGCAPAGAPGAVDCDFGTLAVGNETTIAFTAIVPPDAAAGIDALEFKYDVFTNVAGEDPLGRVYTSIVREADLTITKTLDSTAVSVGDTGKYTITVENAGPTSATNVTVTESLPDSVTFVSSAASTGSYNSTAGEWIVGDLAAGDSATLTIIVTFDVAGEVDNTATVSSDVTDPAPDNDSAVAAAVVTADADLSVTATVDDAAIEQGAEGTFTVVVTNSGPITAQSVIVTDLLPSGVTYVSATASIGTYDSSTGEWVVGDVASGVSATLTITVSFDAEGSIVNTASASSETTDPDLTNNIASVAVAVGSLPATGVDAHQIVLIALLLISTGALLVLFGKRRRFVGAATENQYLPR